MLTNDTPTQPTGRDHDHTREGAGAELDLALGMLQQIRDMSDPTSPALVESMVHAMVDGSCDLSDRDPGREVWDQAREDITLVLPIVREAIAGAVAAEGERIAKAIEAEAVTPGIDFLSKAYLKAANIARSAS